MIKEWDCLVIRNNVLLRRRLTDGHDTFQLILPAEFCDQALRGLHDEVGHPGRDCTLDLVRSLFYWPFMATHTEKYVAHCERCIRRKAPDPPRAPMKSFIAKEPMELLAAYFLLLEKGKGRFENTWLPLTASLISHGHSPPVTRKLQQLPNSYGRRFSSTTECPNVCTPTRVVILRERSSRVCVSLLAYLYRRPAHITHREMDRLKDLTKPFQVCWEPLTKTTSQGGPSTSHRWFMPTTV